MLWINTIAENSASIIIETYFVNHTYHVHSDLHLSHVKKFIWMAKIIRRIKFCNVYLKHRWLQSAIKTANKIVKLVHISIGNIVQHYYVLSLVVNHQNHDRIIFVSRLAFRQHHNHMQHWRRALETENTEQTAKIYVIRSSRKFNNLIANLTQ